MIWQFLSKLQMRIPFDPAVSLLEFIPRVTNECGKPHRGRLYTAVLFVITDIHHQAVVRL